MSKLITPTRAQKTKLKKMSVCILTPHADFECATKFVKSLVNMIAYSHMHGLNVEMIATTERMVVDWARNDLAKLVKNSKSPYTGKKYTHCLWLDDDMVFSPDTAIVLATEMADYDMMSGLYFARHKPLPVVYVRGEEDKDDPYKHYPLMRAPKRVFACDAVGFGCLLMRTDVFDKVPEPWFTIDSRGGEDIVFCKHARDAGLTIGCCGHLLLGHIGQPKIITFEDSEQYLASKPELENNLTQINI